jgi:hypothetical protein
MNERGGRGHVFRNIADSRKEFDLEVDSAFILTYTFGTPEEVS